MQEERRLARGKVTTATERWEGGERESEREKERGARERLAEWI